MKPKDSSLVNIYHLQLCSREDMEFVLNDLLLLPNLRTTSLLFLCKDIEKKDFLEVLRRFLDMLDPQEGLFIGFKTSIEFDLSDLYSLGESLINRPKMKYLCIKGRNLALSYKKQCSIFEVQLIHNPD